MKPSTGALVACALGAARIIALAGLPALGPAGVPAGAALIVIRIVLSFGR